MKHPGPIGVPMIGQERRAVAMLAAVFSIRMLGLFLLLPVIAVYASRFPGASAVMVGLAVGAYGFTQALLQIPFGVLSDRIGRKPVIVAGLVIFAIGSLVAAAATSAEALVLGRALQGAGAISAAITALLADLTRPAVRTRAMAVIGMTIGASFVVALIAGPAIAHWLGFAGLFVVTAALAVVAIAGVVFVVPAPPAPAASTPTGRAIRAALCNRALLQLDAGVFFLHAVLTASFVAVPLALESVAGGVEVVRHSLVYLLALAASLPATVALIIMNERLARAGLWMGIAISLVLAAQLALAVAPAVWAITLSLALFFSGFNFLEARLPARMTELADAEVRGAALGVFATCQFLGAFAGGLCGGWIYGLAGGAGVHLASAGLVILWLLMTTRAGKKAG